MRRGQRQKVGLRAAFRFFQQTSCFGEYGFYFGARILAVQGLCFSRFASGIVNLKDIVYYLAVTYFFLLLTVKTLEAKRWQ